MPQIENTKTITVSLNFEAKIEDSREIFCEFQPDEIILKYVSLYDNSPQLDTNLISFSSSLFNNQNFFTFATPIQNDTSPIFYNEQINTPFKVNSSNVNGLHSFSLKSLYPFANITPADVSVRVAFTFIFIKYKSKNKF